MATANLRQATPVTIQVQFTATTRDTGNDSITQYSLSIVPSAQTLMNAATGSGPTSFTVVFSLVSNVPEAIINKIDDQPSQLPPGFSHRSQNGKKKLVLTFTNKGLRAARTFNYQLQVTAPTVSVTSTDPELMIPPPNG
jgi:hypothetical protein